MDPMLSSSNLAALFKMEKSQNTCSNTKDVSMAYTAPRQPKFPLTQQNKNPQRKTTSSVVHCTKIITLIKSSSATTLSNIDGKDRLGIALIGNEQLESYELILYKDKQNVMHRRKIDPCFVFTVDDDGYNAAFTDEKNVSLRVTFHNEQDCCEFSKCIKHKGGSIVYQKSFAKDDCLSLKEDITSESKPLVISTGTKTKVPKGMPASSLTTNGDEQKRNACNNLSNEPFSYISNPNMAEQVTQNHRQLHRFPFSYKIAQISDIPSSFSANHTLTTDSLHSIMTENRSQSCEMRMHMLQLSSKLDTLIRDVFDIKTQSSINQNNKRWVNNDDLVINGTHLNNELELVMNDVKEENDKLRQQLHSQELDKDQMKHLENENSDLKYHLEHKIEDLNKQLLSVNDLSQELLKLQEADALNKQKIHSLETKCHELSTISEMQKLKLIDLEQCAESRKNISKDRVNRSDASIKKIMNKLYQNLLNAFEIKETYNFGQIEAVVVNNLRRASYEMMGNGEGVVKIIENVNDNEPKECLEDKNFKFI